jgi:apolipoprotein N-acyltransferase
MAPLEKLVSPLRWPRALFVMSGAVLCFHLGYALSDFYPLRLFIFGYLVFLVQLARLKTTRQSFYVGLLTGLLCAAPELSFFWRIFGPAAIPLWLVLAFWTALFVALIHGTLVRFGAKKTALLIPFVWSGVEYFRSELYYLKFSWLNTSYLFADWQLFPIHFLGMYGVGFVLAAFAGLFLVIRWQYAVGIVATFIAFFAFLILTPVVSPKSSELQIAGVQMEFPNEQQIPKILNRLVGKYPQADLLVMSEYTLDGFVPESVKAWCRENHRYLILGGKDPAPNGNFYNTAYVVSPEGEIVFRQVKSVPIQFFKDGLPAPEQNVWDSPWGKIGICICYDLSYTRVTDGLIKKGAQLLVVPTMDVSDWGNRQHELHALVAPTRAAEYRIPIFRLASSGISQAVNADGRVFAKTSFGEEETLSAKFSLHQKGVLPVDRVVAPCAVVVTFLLTITLIHHSRKKPKSVEAPTS